jgi:iron(III) transport system permease protein
MVASKLKSSLAAQPSVVVGLRYRLKSMMRDPTTVVGILLALLFTYLILLPIVSVLIDAVQVKLGDTRRIGGEVGDPTNYYLHRTFLSPVAQNFFWIPLKITLSVAVGAITLSFLIGTPLAWLLSRTDVFGRRWFSTALIVPYMLPSWTFALAWTTLFKNRTIGGQQGWLEAIGLSPPDWMSYGQFSITVILDLHYAPFIILLLGNGLHRFDSQLEILPASLGPRAVRLRCKCFSRSCALGFWPRHYWYSPSVWVISA